jgi:hypothetical protein
VTRAALVDAFTGFPGRMAEAARPAAARDRAVGAGEWGPAEVVRHLIAVEGVVWQSRLAELAADRAAEPHWGWTEPGLAPGFDDASLDAILAAFSTARAVTVAAVVRLDDAGWARTGVHAAYGRLDVAGLLRIATDHDAEHLAAIEEGA